MSSISQFFGGEAKINPASGYIKNPTYLNNTELSNAQSASLDYAYITPIDDEYFYLLTATDSTSGYYAQIYKLNSDSTISSVVATLNVGAFGIQAFTCTGTNALSVRWDNGNSYPYMDKFIWNGSSTITSTQLKQGYSYSNNRLATVGTVLTDGRLMMLMSQLGYSTGKVHYACMDTDGNTGLIDDKSTNFKRSDADHFATACGTGDGIYVIGQHESNSNRLNGFKVFPKLNSTTTPDSSEAYMANASRTNFKYFSIVPMKQGGCLSTFLTDNGTSGTNTRRIYTVQTAHQPVITEMFSGNTGNGTDFGSYYIGQNDGTTGNIKYPLHRCANGSYQDREFNLVTFDEGIYSFPVPKDNFNSMRRVAGTAFTGNKGSTCLMGDRVLNCLRDNANNKLNINVWRLPS